MNDRTDAPAGSPFGAAGPPPISAPSPLLDDGIALDAYASARIAGDRLAITLASGLVVDGVCTVPAPGVLRVRIGPSLGAPAPSPMLVAFEERPAALHERDGAIVIEGHGLHAAWTGSLLVCGTWRRAPALANLTDAAATAGRVELPGGGTGWLESVSLGADDALYGGGESFQGPDLRGRTRTLVNRETHGAAGFDLSYLNVPLFWSDAGWGMFVHTAAPVRADLGAAHAEVAAVVAEGAELDLFLIAGDAPTILRRYLALTGMPGAFPSWALGVWTSRCSYLSERDIDDVLDGYEASGCPVDVVHVDAWVSGNVIEDLTCNWTIDRDRFPEGWTSRLAERGVAVSLWHNPYLLEGSPRAREAEDAGLLLRTVTGALARTPDKPDRFLIDFTNPDAYAWWQERVRTTVAAEGNAAFKPDFAEEVPFDALFADGRTGREFRNAYALVYQRATHDALAAATRDDAVALFCRSGTAGSQRYPCHWVGDTPSTWDGLVSALRACLSLSLSGFAFVSHDIGGFWTPRSFAWVASSFAGMDPSAFEADVEADLYARWTQWGALSGVMRFHGTGRREPYVYPEPYRTAAIEACRLRDRMRPYLERCAAEAVRDGAPMMRPMPYAYPGDRGARDADLQYLLGPSVLVAPVLSPDGRRRVWVPHGSWDGLVGLGSVQGPGWIDVGCDVHTFPAWVRRGAIVV